MSITVRFYSYFKDLTGCAETVEMLAGGATLGELAEALAARFPPFGAMRGSALLAVGVEYQDAAYVLKPGDEVAVFPPVQGG